MSELVKLVSPYGVKVRVAEAHVEELLRSGFTRRESGNDEEAKPAQRRNRTARQN